MALLQICFNICQETKVALMQHKWIYTCIVSWIKADSLTEIFSKFAAKIIIRYFLDKCTLFSSSVTFASASSIHNYHFFFIFSFSLLNKTLPGVDDLGIMVGYWYNQFIFLPKVVSLGLTCWIGAFLWNRYQFQLQANLESRITSASKADATYRTFATNVS